MSVDGRVARGVRTRTAVLDAAVALATAHGLDGLSLGQLAERLTVSKSGLFAHWRSKEELQLAAVEHAQAQWAEQVMSPALRAPRGVRRLFAMHESRLAFYAGPEALPGGCFFATVEFEFSNRPGPVRDRIAQVLTNWLAVLERLATEALDAGELLPLVDAAQLAYEIEALGMAAVVQSRLRAPSIEPYARSRAAVLTRLRGLSTDPTLLPEA